MSTRQVWWDRGRAAFLAFHVVGVLLMALPSPAGLLTRSAWKEPSVQAEFATWADTFRAVGVDTTVPELEESLWNLATAYGETHSWLMTPYQPYKKWLGVNQSWQMFPAPQRRPAILVIEIWRTDRWETVYRARSAEYAWNRSFFDQDRIRTMMFLYTWPHIRKRGLFKDFVTYLGPALARDFPDADRARFRFYRYTTPSPSEVRAGVEPQGRYESNDVLKLGDFR